MTPWWSAASIRTRLTTWYSVSMFVMLSAYAAATYAAVRHEFFEQVDDQLHDDFENVEQSLSISTDGHVTSPLDHTFDPDADAREHGSEVWSLVGEPMYRSSSASTLPALKIESNTPPRRLESIVANGERWRTYLGPVRVGTQSVLVRVSRSEERPREQLREVLVVLVFGLPLVVALAGIGGYVLARRALAPIDHLAAAARRITAERLHERLSVPNERDEVGQLAAIINETFARLEASFEQLRRFTADASHELRTPLAVIRGIGEAGVTGNRTPSEYKEAIGSMLEEVDRLTNLVDSLLRLSHADAGRVRLTRESVDLGALARDTAASLAVLAEERNQQVRIHAQDTVLVEADRLLLREALTNVLDNAVKYSPRSSAIDVDVSESDGHAILTIADEGSGITVEYRERIFDRFFRVDEGRSRDAGGTGLGLAIAKWAVEVNGGQISVGGRDPQGSVFRIQLPIATVARGDSQRRGSRHDHTEGLS